MPPGSAVEPRGVESGISARVGRRRRRTRAEMPASSKRARRARCARRCGDIVSASSTPDGGQGGPDARACGGPVSKSATKARDRSECSKKIVGIPGFSPSPVSARDAFVADLDTSALQPVPRVREHSRACSPMAGRSCRASGLASRTASPDRSRCGTEPISVRNRTDLGAELNRSRRRATPRPRRPRSPRGAGAGSWPPR